MNKKRILAVEDDMDVAELLLMFFQGQGYEVYHAETGAEGIAIARSKLPNLIMLDIMLPDMDGFDICREVRSTNLTKYIPTIFLTQKNTRADRVSGLELGADDYITKPFDIEELRVRVEKSIHRATRDHLHEEITGLPTGPLIEEQFAVFMNGGGWHRLDVHIVGFDAFHDAYGFLTANDALNLAAKVLTDSVVAQGTDNDFIAIVDRGDFIIFTYSKQAKQLAQEAAKQFQERVEALYRFSDVEQGYLLLDQGTSQEKKIPLMRFETEIKPYNL